GDDDLRCPVEPQHAVRRRRPERERRQLLDAVGGLERKGCSREPEPREVLVEQERASAVHAHRLERGTAAKERLVVGAEHRLARIDETAAGDCDGEQRHAGTSPPTAARSGRAFTHDSSTSASGSESQTTPPPTHRWMRPSATANVRIVNESSKSPFGQTVPSAPIEAPRPTGSSRATWSIAASFGAPVIDP